MTLDFSEVVLPKSALGGHGKQPVDESIDGIAGNGVTSQVGKEKKWLFLIFGSALPKREGAVFIFVTVRNPSRFSFVTFILWYSFNLKSFGKYLGSHSSSFPSCST
jgi:hypothetical protein